MTARATAPAHFERLLFSSPVVRETCERRSRRAGSKGGSDAPHEDRHAPHYRRPASAAPAVRRRLRVAAGRGAGCQHRHGVRGGPPHRRRRQRSDRECHVRGGWGQLRRGRRNRRSRGAGRRGEGRPGRPDGDPRSHRHPRAFPGGARRAHRCPRAQGLLRGRRGHGPRTRCRRGRVPGPGGDHSRRPALPDGRAGHHDAGAGTHGDSLLDHDRGRGAGGSAGARRARGRRRQDLGRRPRRPVREDVPRSCIPRSSTRRTSTDCG